MVIISRIYKKESLDEHIKNCLDVLSDIKDSKINIVIKNIEDKLKLAIIFHDSGKIFYQNIINKLKSFLSHEILSCYIVYLVFNAILESNNKEIPIEEIENLRDFVGCLVLYHHYSMGIESRLKKLREIYLKNINLFELSFKLSKEVLEEHKNIVIKNIRESKINLSNVELELSELISNSLEKVNEKLIKKGSINLGSIINVVKEFNKNIWKRFISDKQFRKEAIVGIAILNVIDNLSVKDNESYKFKEVIEDFVKIYKICSHIKLPE